MAAALGDDANFSTTITNSIAAKLPLAGGALTGAVTTNSTFDGRNVSVDGSKLDGIETGATADQTAAEILTAVKTVDGSGSGLDADLLDGQHASAFQAAGSYLTAETVSSTNAVTITGTKYFQSAGTATSPLGGGGGASLQAYTTGTTAAYMAFHRSAAYAINWGLDTSNTMVLGGWSSSTTAARMSIGTNGLMVTAGQGNLWGASNDGSGSGLDADLLDGADSSVFFKSPSNVSGWQNTNRNFSIRTGGSATGLHMEESDGTFGFQLYGDSGSYGFLDGEWANWDIQKVVNGTFKVDEGSGLKRVLNEGNWTSYITLPTAATLTGTAPTGSPFLSNFVHLGTATTTGYATDDGGWGSRLNVSSAIHAKIEVAQEANSMRSAWYAHTGHTGIKFGTLTSHVVDFITAGSVRMSIPNNSGLVTTTGQGTLWGSSNDGSGSGLDADLLDGLELHTGRNNEANKVVRTDANGYIQSYYINTNIGISEALSLDITKIYVSNDNYIRTMGKSNFKVRMGLSKTEYDRMDYTAITHYHTGANSHNEVTINGLWERGSGFIDNWNSGAGKPPSGSHFNGFQALHYSSSSVYHHGMQMLMSAGNPALTYLRGHWANGGTGNAWQKIWTDGNDGSGSGLDADLLDGIDSTFFNRGVSSHGVFPGSSGNNLNDVFTGNGAKAGFIDAWAGTNFPPNTTHIQGIQTRHNTGAHYGWQLFGQYNQLGKLYHRQVSNGTFGAWSQLWNNNNDGSGSGLDSDTVDGIQGASLLRSDATDTATGSISLRGGGNHLGNHEFASSSTGTSYSTAAIELRESNYTGTGSATAPRIGFHWGGVVASNIAMDSAGTIEILNNPGTGYEEIRAANFYVGSGTTAVWYSGNDGSGSGLDADLLDGANAAENGASTIHKLASNAYSQLQNWTNVAGSGLYSGTTNSAHWYPNTANSYGTWRIDGARGGYSGIYLNNGGAVVIGMYDSAGNGGDYHQASGKWSHYWHRGNTCLAINGSTTSSSYALYSNGAIYSTNNIVAYSDRRVKENIVQIDGALEKVNKLTGVYYNKIDDEKKNKEIGFIAQDVNEVVPELVAYAEDVDQYGVKYGNTTALLVEAVKELTQQVKDLKQEIDKMKEKQ